MIHMVRYAYLSVELVFVFAFTHEKHEILWKSTVPRVFTGKQGNV